MVTSLISSRNGNVEIVLTSNRSATELGNRLLLWSVCGLGLMMSIMFLSIGAWLILPFIGIELLLLAWVLRCVSHKSCEYQIVAIQSDLITIEHNRLRCEFHRDRLQLLVIAPQRYTDCSHLLLCGDGRTIQLGDFLNDTDRRMLQKLLCDFVRLRWVLHNNDVVQEF